MESNEIIKALRHCAVNGSTCRECPAYNQDSGCLDRLHAQAAELLEAQQRRIAELEEQKRWIPVTERLPDAVPCGAGTAYSEAVNVLTSGRKVLTAIWDGMEFIADAEFWEAYGETITHWAPVLLPLPEAPKEDV